MPKPLDPFATVFFIGHNWGSVGLSLRVWLACAAVVILTRSRLAHVTLGHGPAVYDPSSGGDRYWPIIAFAQSYPNIVCAVDVPVYEGFDLDSFEFTHRRSMIRAALRGLSLGFLPANDCVSAVAHRLRAGGVPVPPRITTPVQLHDWILANASLRHARFPGSPPRTCRGPHP